MVKGVSLSRRPSARRKRAEIDAHHAAAVADRPQLLVGQIARLRAQGVGIGWVATNGDVE